eukprot:766050-Hanusia_phi.AAC.1
MVTVVGQGFERGSRPICKFGEQLVDGTFQSSTKVLCISPVHVAGNVSLGLSMNGEDYTRSVCSFHYVSRVTILSIHPSVGSVNGGDSITIVGNHLSLVERCHIHYLSLNNLFFRNESWITIVLPQHSGGKFKLCCVGQAYFACNFFLFFHTQISIMYFHDDSNSLTIQFSGIGFGENLRCACFDNVFKADFVSSTKLDCAIGQANSHQLSTVFLLDKTGQPITDEIQFFPPSIQIKYLSFNPFNGSLLTVVGRNFDENMNYKCSYRQNNSVIPVHATFLSQQYVVCQLPKSVQTESFILVFIVNYVYAYDCGALLPKNRSMFVDVNPSQSGLYGGTLITITGGKFDKRGDLRCQFSKKQVHVSWLSSTFLSCITPSNAEGITALAVVDLARNVSSNEVQFQFIAQFQFFSIYPTRLFLVSHRTITIYGSSFMPGLFCRIQGISAITKVLTSSMLACELNMNRHLQLERNNFSTVEVWISFKSTQNSVFKASVPISYDVEEVILHPLTVFLNSIVEIHLISTIFTVDILEKVLIGNSPLDVVEKVNDMEFVCRAPAFKNPGNQTVTLLFKNSGPHVLNKTLNIIQPFKCQLTTTVGSVEGGNHVTVTMQSNWSWNSLSCHFGELVVFAKSHSATHVTCTSPSYREGITPFSLRSENQSVNLCDNLFQFVVVPQLIAVVPSSGPSFGGIMIKLMLSGHMVDGSCRCIFGSDSIGSPVYQVEHEYTCRLPRLPSGPGHISLRWDESELSSNRKDLLIYNNLTLVKIFPTVGPSTGNFYVTLHVNANLSQYENISCHFGKAISTSDVSTNDRLRCLAPPYPSGNVLVKLYSDGILISLNALWLHYRNFSNHIRLNPSCGPVLGGTHVEIALDNLIPAVCFFGSQEVPVLKDQKKAICISPPGEHLGIVAFSLDVGVMNLSFAYEKELEIYSVIPTIGTIGQRTIFTVFGYKFFNSKDYFCQFGRDDLTAAVYQTSSKLLCAITHFEHKNILIDVVGPCNVKSKSRPLIHYLSAPEILSIQPTMLFEPKANALTVLGRGFNSCNSSIMQIGTRQSYKCNFVSSEALLFEMSGIKHGNYSVSFTFGQNIIGPAILIQVVESYPFINSVQTAFIPEARALRLLISGNNFFFHQSLFCQIGRHAFPVQFIDDKTLLCMVSCTLIEANEVSVTILLERQQISNTLKIHGSKFPQPTFKVNITPPIAFVDNDTTIQISTSGLIQSQMKYLCRVQDQFQDSIIRDSKSLLCIIPRGPFGVVNLQVYSSGHCQSKIDLTVFRVNFPIVTSLSPTAALALQPLTFTVSGRHFHSNVLLSFGNMECVKIYVTMKQVICHVKQFFLPGKFRFYIEYNGFIRAQNIEIQIAINSFNMELHPSLGPLSGGTKVQILFKKLPKGNLVCHFGESMVASITESSSAISCLSPSRPYEGPVQVLIMANSTVIETNHADFKYFKDFHLRKIHPSFGYQNTKPTVTLVGNDFISDDSLFCLFDSQSIKASCISSSVVICSAPFLELGANLSMQVKLFISNGYESNEMQFNILEPIRLTSIAPLQGNPGIEVTVRGMNFPSSWPVSFMFGKKLQPSKSQTSTLLLCIVPSMKISNVTLMLSFDGQDLLGTKFSFFILGGLTILGLFPSEGCISGGKNATIQYDGFIGGELFYCNFDGSTSRLHLLNHSFGSCVIPSKTQGTIDVDLISQNRKSINSMKFRFTSSPQISRGYFRNCRIFPRICRIYPLKSPTTL